MNMQLEETFIKKYRQILGEQADLFLASFNEEAVSGFRTNPLKEQIHFEFPKIPHTKWGYYGKVSGKSPEYVSGMVYSQEPAAQMVVQSAEIKPNQRILDLSAAPGGKSTHILSYLNNTGLLVSNEISKKRSKILVENIERFGARNVVVMNESAERLARSFHKYFDVIIFDGPCSGEGMFRKDPSAMTYWTESYPCECSKLQKQIIEDCLSMLADGGRFVYSTCTWSKEENEDVVSWILDNYPEFKLVDVPKVNGMSEGIGLPQTARMYPHLFKGEGQFVAVLQSLKTSYSSSVKTGKSNLTKEQLKLWQEFSLENLLISFDGIYQVFGEELYLLPNGLPDLKKLKIARNGLHLGTFKKKRFEPSFALGVALKQKEVVNTIDINEEQFRQYVSGNIVNLDQEYPKGWYQICIHQNGIGFSKVVGNTIKNSFPKGLRFQS